MILFYFLFFSDFFWTVEEKLIFLVYFFTVLNICVFNFSLSFFGEPELLEDTGKRTEKKDRSRKKKERNVKCSLKRDPSSHSFYHAPGQSRHVSQVCSSA